MSAVATVAVAVILEPCNPVVSVHGGFHDVLLSSWVQVGVPWRLTVQVRNHHTEFPGELSCRAKISIFP